MDREPGEKDLDLAKRRAAYAYDNSRVDGKTEKLAKAVLALIDEVERLRNEVDELKRKG